ncbi:hypothetical protein GCM10023096_26240 [Nonomuraea ferruginea]
MLSMTPAYLVVLALVLTLVSATIAYLIARSRATADRTALKIAEERRNQASERADALLAERDMARRQLAELGQAHTTALTERRGLDEQLGRLSAELDAVRNGFQRREADARRLQLMLEAEQGEKAETGRRLREAEVSIAASTGRETELRTEIQALRAQITELTMQKQALLEQAASVHAVRQELDQTRVDNNQLLEKTLRATAADMLKKSQDELVTRAEATLGAVSKPGPRAVDGDGPAAQGIHQHPCRGRGHAEPAVDQSDGGGAPDPERDPCSGRGAQEAAGAWAVGRDAPQKGRGAGGARRTL